MEAAKAALAKLGWHLTAEGIEECLKGCKEKDGIDTTALEKAAIDLDLRAYGEKAVSDDVGRGGRAEVHGPLVLQLQRMKDVSQPMAAQKDPLRVDTGGGGQRMLKLQLTDGKCHFSALEIDKLIELGNSVLPPGTKIRIKSGFKLQSRNGFLMLYPGCFSVLGGQVEALMKKWKAGQAEGRKDTELAKAGPPPFVPYEIFLRTNPQRPRPKQPAATQRSSTKELHPQPKHQSLPPREDSKTLLHGDTGQKPQLGSNPTKTSEKDVTTGSGGAAVKGLGNQGVRGGGEDRFTKDSGHQNQRPSRDAPPAQSSQSGGGGRQSQGFRGERNGISMKWPATQSTEGKKYSSDEGHNRSFQTQGTRGGEKNQRLQSDHNQRKGEQSGKDEQSQHSRTLQQKCDRAGLPSTQGHLTQKDRNHGGVPLTQRTQPQKNMETRDNPVSQNRGRADRYDPSTREKQRLQGHDAPRHWVQQGRWRERQWTAGSSGRPESSHHATGESASQTVSSNVGSDSGGVPLTQRTQPQKDMETRDNFSSQNRGRADRYDPSTREKQQMQGYDAPRHWVQQGRWKERQWTAGSSGRPESSHHATGESASRTVSSNVGSDCGDAPLTQRTQPQKDMETRDNSSSQNRGRADRYDPSTREKQQMQGYDAPRHWVQQGRWRERQWTAGSSGRPGSSRHPTGESASQTVSSSVGSDRCPPSRDGTTPKSHGTATSDVPHKPSQDNLVSIRSFSYHNRRLRNPPEQEGVRGGRSSLKAQSSSSPAPTESTSLASSGGKPERNVPYTATQVKKTHGT